MAAQTYTITGSTQNVVNYVYLTIEATVSQADTITVSQLTTVSDAFCINKSTAAEIAVTQATNVITISGAATSAKVVLFVIGIV